MSQFTPEFKAKLVIEFLRIEKYLNQIATDNVIHPNFLRSWKKDILSNAINAFENKLRNPLHDKLSKECKEVEQYDKKV